MSIQESFKLPPGGLPLPSAHTDMFCCTGNRAKPAQDMLTIDIRTFAVVALCAVRIWTGGWIRLLNPAFPTSKFNLVFVECRSLTWYFCMSKLNFNIDAQGNYLNTGNHFQFLFLTAPTSPPLLGRWLSAARPVS